MLSSDHTFNQLFKPKTKVCNRSWIMEDEKAERRMEVRNRSVQWEEVTLTQIYLLRQTAIRACSGHITDEKPTSANGGWAERYEMYIHAFSHSHKDRQMGRNLLQGNTGQGACTIHISCIMEESEHNTDSRTFSALVYSMWRVLFTSSQMAYQRGTGKQAKWEWGELWYFMCSKCVFVCFLPCSCWPYFSAENVWCFIQDGESKWKETGW